MFCYRVIHLFFTKKPDHIHYFGVGIYDSRKQAERVTQMLKTKDGFSLRPDKFYIIKVFCFRRPKFLNQTYWTDGFITYTYTK